MGVKRPGRENDHSPPSSAEVKNAWNYTSTPPVRLHGVVLSYEKHRDFTFTFNFTLPPIFPGRTSSGSRDSSVGTALGCGLDNRDSRVRFPAGAGNFSLHHRVQNGSGPHPTSYPMGTRGSFLWVKAVGAWSWQLTTRRGQRISRAIPLLPQYSFMAWYSKKKAQGQLYLLLARGRLQMEWR
jgi:hypothetical protein